MLRKTLYTVGLCTALALGAPAKAGLEEGIAAANIGDFETALNEFQYLADKGFAPGIYELGQLYENGFGVVKSQD